MMIDGSYVSISSVNLNNRSFIQDSENGIAVLDRAFYKRMRPVFDSYVQRSRPIDTDVEVPLVLPVAVFGAACATRRSESLRKELRVLEKHLSKSRLAPGKRGIFSDGDLRNAALRK